jgi:hypothetical protein
MRTNHVTDRRENLEDHEIFYSAELFRNEVIIL